VLQGEIMLVTGEGGQRMDCNVLDFVVDVPEVSRETPVELDVTCESSDCSARAVQVVGRELHSRVAASSGLR
jgi:hypothetical protein